MVIWIVSGWFVGWLCGWLVDDVWMVFLMVEDGYWMVIWMVEDCYWIVFGWLWMVIGWFVGWLWMVIGCFFEWLWIVHASVRGGRRHSRPSCGQSQLDSHKPTAAFRLCACPPWPWPWPWPCSWPNAPDGKKSQTSDWQSRPGPSHAWRAKPVIVNSELLELSRCDHAYESASYRCPSESGCVPSSTKSDICAAKCAAASSSPGDPCVGGAVS